MSTKIGIVGFEEEVLVFKGLGFVPVFVSSQIEAVDVLLDIKKNNNHDFGIVFVMEDIFSKLDGEVLEKIAQGALPAFIPVPGHVGATGFGNNRMRRFIEQAVGSDIFA